MTPKALKLVAAIAIGFSSAILTMPAVAAEPVKPITVRFSADFPPPPHPTGLAMQYFAKRLPEVVPGSRVQLYFAASLYTDPQAFDAMRQGNLEMSWLQTGKVASVDPWLLSIVGPGTLTTVGAVEKIGETKTYQEIVKHLQSKDGVKLLGEADMSFGQGIGGSKKRFVGPSDFHDNTIRTQGPIQNATLQAWGASPVVMSYGDTANALQSGVVTGLITSLSAWSSLRDQAPYYTIGGPGVYVGDYYLVAASERWWNKLDANQRAALEQVLKETIALQNDLNWCSDRNIINKYKAQDPSKPGVYELSQKQIDALVDALGDKANEAKRTLAKGDPDVIRLIDQFQTESRALTKANPAGSAPVEHLDCSKYEHYFQMKR